MASSLHGQRIAVVGAGITGLSAAWLLHRSGAAVTLFEKERSFGGHTLTDTSSPYPVDLGFQVYNLTTYPNLVGFLEQLGVETEPSDMSFALSLDDGALEWGSVGDLDTIFAQRRNCFRPSFLRMVYDVVRFGQQAPEVLKDANQHIYKGMTLRAYLSRHGYSQVFTTNYLLPMCAAVWSVPNAQVLEFPVQMLVRFWVNHHLLDLVQRPNWRVVKDRSQQYVQKVIAELPDARAGTPVTSAVRNVSGGVTLTLGDGSRETFDAVVLATHSDVTLDILGDGATAEEARLLRAIPYNTNDVYLHTDLDLMPRNRKVWSSWNFLGRSDDPGTSAVCVSYWLNKLQNLPAEAPQMFVTLNPPRPPAPDKTLRRLALAHPVYSFESVEAQQQLATIQGTGGVYFAGAWCGYGFHEDGLKAGIAAATALGASVPWVPRSVSPKVSLTDAFFLSVFDKFGRMAISRGYLRLILPDGSERHYGSKDDVDPATPAGDAWRGRPSALRATLRVFNMSMFRKIVIRHDTGMGEAYMDGDYECDDIGAFLAVVTANARHLEGKRGALGVLNWLGDWMLHLAHIGKSNTIQGSRKNIEEHYDAGNAMYKLFLDDSMTYSAGIHHEGDSLHQAQMNKIDAIIKHAGITSTDHVLEVGCGWGSFAIRAAQSTGCRVIGITISKEQLAEATARVAAAGLQDRVTLMFCDYRDCPGAGTFDKVVSIEMIEAVGHEHMKPYFAMLGRMLKPGGTAVIQAITQPDERYEAYCSGSDFIRAHVFPGGHLPSMGSMVEAARGTGLAVQAVTDIGPDYAMTLRAWRQAWEERKAEVLQLGYSERFWRKYRFYFVYCEAAFDARYIQDYHIVWKKDQAEQQQQPLGAEDEAVEALTVVRERVMEQLPADPLTQILLALYFWLAGVITASHRWLWLLPAVSMLFVALNYAVGATARRFSSCYSRMTPENKAWLCSDVSHLIYSAAVSFASLSYVLHEPRALVMFHAPESLDAPRIITCASTGFFAYQLWTCVKYRLFARSRTAIAQYTLLLILFGIAAVKNVHVAFLSATLTSEVASCFFLAGKIQDLAAASGGAVCVPLRRACRVAEKFTFLTFRAVPQLIITVVLLLSPGAFSSYVYHLLALTGMAYCNWANWRKAQLVFGKQAGTAVDAAAIKQHTS